MPGSGELGPTSASVPVAAASSQLRGGSNRCALLDRAVARGGGSRTRSTGNQAVTVSGTAENLQLLCAQCNREKGAGALVVRAGASRLPWPRTRLAR